MLSSLAFIVACVVSSLEFSVACVVSSLVFCVVLELSILLNISFFSSSSNFSMAGEVKCSGVNLIYYNQSGECVG